MTSEMIAEILIKIIIEYKKQIKYSALSLRDQIESDYLMKIDDLYRNDEESMQEATVKILTGQAHCLDLEEIKIQMECAGIWCNEPIYLQVMRIRYHLSIDSAEDISYLSRIIYNAYIHVSDSGMSSMSKIDRESSVENFFIKLCNSKISCDKRLYATASSISLLPPDKNIPSVIAFISLQKILGKKEITSKSNSNIYIAVTEISEICIDGLQLWTCNSNEKRLQKLVLALKETNVTELFIQLSDYYLALSNLIKNSERNYKDFCKHPSEEFIMLTKKHEKAIYNYIDTGNFEKQLEACL